MHLPRLGKHTRIVDRDVELQVAKVDTPVTLDNMQLFGPRIEIHPAAIVKTDSVDYERIGLPFPHGVSLPGRIRIRRMFTTVQENLAIAWNAFRQDDE